MIRSVTVTGLLLLVAAPLHAQETINRGNNLSVDVAVDGRIAIDLVGDIWIVPARGGEARQVTRDSDSATRPRWSRDASRVAYQSNTDGVQGIRVLDLEEMQDRNISTESSFDMQPDWHPDQQRLVFARDKTGAGFDLWEIDLPTGLQWRLTDRPGDETEPAWSRDGRDLVYIHHYEDRWSLVLRRFGLPDEILLATTDRLLAPAWRPDGSLVTFLRDSEGTTSLDMAILSQPRLIRTYASGESFDRSRVSWLDRHTMFYTVDGRIRQRSFDSRTSSPLLFRATLQAAFPATAVAVERRELPRIDEPAGRLVIHAARLFDGIGNNYESNRDIVIEGGRISAVEPHREHPADIVIEMGDLTVIPGLVDARAHLHGVANDRFGALLLTTGVTTVVAGVANHERFNALWSSKEQPGPRVMADDGRLDGNVRALADSMTPGLQDLLRSRQSQLIGSPGPIARRFAEPPRIDAGMTSMVVASRGNGLQPGVALHAELRALAAAGLGPDQALRAAGVNAAAALGVDPYLGRIAVGAVADLVFIDGDPLDDINDALNVVAVVRNGRFFSVAGLIERAAAPESVE